MTGNDAALASIIVVTYNSRQYVEANIGSLLETLPPGCEVIVVDNASTDGTPDTIARGFPTVRIVRNRDNVGFAAANNQAAALANGQYLVLINPDTSVEGQWLEPLLAPLRNKACADGTPVGLTTPKIVMMHDPSVINTAGNEVHVSGITACRGYGEPASAVTYETDATVPAVSGACFAIRKDLWCHLGGFDESFFMYLEDTDLSLRAQIAGYSCLYVAGSVVRHDYRNVFAPQKLFFLERNRLLMMTKNLRPSTMLLLAPAMITVEILGIGYAASRGMGAMRSFFSAYADFIRRVAARPRSQSRTVSDTVVLRRLAARLPVTQISSPRLERLLNAVLTPVFDAALWFASRLAR